MAATPIFKPAGMPRLATIKKIDLATMTAYITFRSDSPSGVDGTDQVPAQLPISYLSSGGGFIGGYPAPGTPVMAVQAEGSNHYIIICFLARDPAAKLTTSATKINIPKLSPGEITIQANTKGSINLNSDSIIIGEPNNFVSFDIERSIYFNTFDYSYYIGQGGKEINGVVKRNRRPKINYPSSLQNYDPSYDDNLKIIGMDPISDAHNFNAGSATRNPARIEKRTVVLEYEEAADIKSNDIELEFYKTGVFQNNPYIIDRRAGRADALSLSLVSPNYLIEKIEGTVVDLYGNIVDLNRDIIPIGKDTTGKTQISISQVKSTSSETDTFKNIYEQIKRLERKSLAFHFEVNARKETGGVGIPDINDRSEYARARSRFSFDIDKEGQFKLNVPASSETGNISLLTRQENYSTVYPNPKSNDPNDLVFNDLYKDILIESFINTQPIKLVDNAGNNVGPIDRFSNVNNPQYIGHGTAYHDISKTCSTLQTNGFYKPIEYTATTDIGSAVKLPYIVSPKIITTGPNANAGGRSGSLNFDGSIEISIGSNSVDRQSLWADLEGGAVVNVGRDLNGVSLASHFDGQVLVEVGGTTTPGGKRFPGMNTGIMAGVVDVRVMNAQGEYTILRIENGGISVSTPGRMVFYSAQDMMFRSSSRITMDCENLILNGRSVIKDPSRGPIR